jgi:hypothetical protein
MTARIEAWTSVINWFVPLLVGTMFTLMGSVKLYGYMRGVEGGADKPFAQRLCGT